MTEHALTILPPSPTAPAVAEALLAAVLQLVGDPARLALPAAPTAPPLADCVPLALAALAGRAPETVDTYRYSLAYFLAYLRDERGADPARLSPQLLTLTDHEDYAIHLLARHGRAHLSTIKVYLAAVRALWRFLDARDWIAPTCTAERVRTRHGAVLGRGGRYRMRRPDPALPQLVAAALALHEPHPDAPPAQRLTRLRDRALLLTLYGTGLRRAELVALNRAALADGARDEARVVGKGDKERVVYFDPESQAAIRAYCAARPDAYRPLWLRYDRARGAPGPEGEHWRLSVQAVWQLVAAYAAAAGVTATPHMFRHLFATRLLNGGAQLDEVQDLLGHSSPATTKLVYAHYHQPHLRAVFQRGHQSAAEATSALKEPS
jgi:site-specific recombinase XerD